MQTVEHESFGSPSEIREFPNGHAEILNVGEATIGRLVLEPGWRWSTSVMPIAKTKSCEAPHYQYHVYGILKIKMDDGTEKTLNPGEAYVIQPGHDAWVVGDENVVVVDWYGATDWAKQPSSDAAMRA